MAVSWKTIIVILIIAAVGYYVYFIRMKGKVNVSESGVQTQSRDIEMTADELYAAGNTAFNAQQTQKMLELYKKAFKKEPKHPKAEDAYYNIGKAYENDLDFASAYKAYKTYLAKYPNGKYKEIAEKAAMRMELQGGSK